MNGRILKVINLGTLQMPDTAATKTFAILAKRGAGKSYTGAVMAEEFYKNNIPFVVFDPIDVWWGLKLSKDGQSPGLDVVVFGVGENADIPLNKDMGVEIAQQVVKYNVSCIISTFGMSKTAQRQLIADFSEELLKINDTPRHIFIEEAHEFVPQRVMGAMARTYAAVEALVTMGRNRRLGVTLVNQRAATINKDVLTQLDTLIALRSLGPQDRKALMEYVYTHSAEGDFNKFIADLPTLPTGIAYVWSPEFLKKFEKIEIRKRETFHPDSENVADIGLVVNAMIEGSAMSNFMNSFSQKEAETTEDKSKFRRHDNSPFVVNKEDTAQEIAKAKDEVHAHYQPIIRKKDAEILLLKKRIEIAQTALNGGLKITTPTGHPDVEVNIVGNSNNVEMWIDKVGRGSGAGRILQFLFEKSGMKFTKSQVALAIGMSPKGGSFNSYIQHLKRNNLILEMNKEFQVNPDL